jgi:hypothetical protein
VTNNGGDTSSPSGTIQSALKSADAGATTLVTAQPFPTEIAVDASGIYWINQGGYYGTPSTVVVGGLEHAALDGSSVTTLVSPASAALVAVAVGVNDVFWSEQDDQTGTIKKMPKAGGPASVVATTHAGLGGRLVLHGGNVYWSQTSFSLFQPDGGAESSSNAGPEEDGGDDGGGSVMTACQ